ncbi:hypothetical protein BC828DRAFT_371737 [Blastocladiella britannica]|nr:hypothetical protein BC828DRAFT_371737 [Blastocladiella britannica]
MAQTRSGPTPAGQPPPHAPLTSSSTAHSNGSPLVGSPKSAGSRARPSRQSSASSSPALSSSTLGRGGGHSSRPPSRRTSPTRMAASGAGGHGRRTPSSSSSSAPSSAPNTVVSSPVVGSVRSAVVPAVTTSESETDEDWDLANSTDDNANADDDDDDDDEGGDASAASGGDSTAYYAANSSMASTVIFGTPSLPPSRRSYSEGAGITSGASAAHGRGGSMAGGHLDLDAVVVPLLPPGTLAAFSALPVGEAWRLTRARVALDRGGGRVDPSRLYLAASDLSDTACNGSGNVPLPTRLLAIFLLYALYIDPELPVFVSPDFPIPPPDPGLHDTGDDDTNDVSAATTVQPLGAWTSPLVQACHPPLPPHTVAKYHTLPRHVQLSVAVSSSHPFLSILLHVSNTAFRQDAAGHALTALLLASPRSPGRPHVTRDPAFLAKSMVHHATFLEGLREMVDEALVAERTVETAFWILGEMVMEIERRVAGLAGPRFVPLSSFEIELGADTFQSTAAANIEPAHGGDISRPASPRRSSSRQTSAPPSSPPAAPPGLNKATAAQPHHPALEAAIEDASTTATDVLAVPLPPTIPLSILGPSTRVTGLIAQSPDVAIEVLARIPRAALASGPVADVVLRPPAPVRLAHLQVVHKLWARGALDPDALPAFVSWLVGEALRSASVRTVQLVCFFLLMFSLKRRILICVWHRRPSLSPNTFPICRRRACWKCATFVPSISGSATSCPCTKRWWH